MVGIYKYVLARFKMNSKEQKMKNEKENQKKPQNKQTHKPGFSVIFLIIFSYLNFLPCCFARPSRQF